LRYQYKSNRFLQKFDELRIFEGRDRILQKWEIWSDREFLESGSKVQKFRFI